MTDDTLDKIAESIGEITEERDEEHDEKVDDDDVEKFDVEEYRRNMNEYEGGW